MVQAGELQGRPPQCGRVGRERFQPYPSAIFRSIYVVLKTFPSILWEALQLFPACPTLLDSGLLAEMSTDSWSVFLGHKWWWQWDALQGDVWPLWAPAGWSWFLSSSGTGIGCIFPFLINWPDQCCTQTPALARGIPCLGPLQVSLGFRWFSWGGKKWTDISRAWRLHRQTEGCRSKDTNSHHPEN